MLERDRGLRTTLNQRGRPADASIEQSTHTILHVVVLWQVHDVGMLHVDEVFHLELHCTLLSSSCVARLTCYTNQYYSHTEALLMFMLARVSPAC